MGCYMKSLQTSTLLKKKYTFNILDTIEVEIQVADNTYNLPIEEFFTMAARINKKRSFLFVSKVLGKHLPINPSTGLLTSALLASKYMEVVRGEKCVEREKLLTVFKNMGNYQGAPFVPAHIYPVVIGFAETATSLGHAFFDCFHSAEFFHTTREVLAKEEPKVTFEEEHSHATSHRCYIPSDMIDNRREVILVDDEITTGKTALNIIHSLHDTYPRDEYTVVSILDWRSKEDRDNFQQLELKLGIKINVVSLISGTVQIKQSKEIAERINLINHSQKVEPIVEYIEMSTCFTTTNYYSNRKLSEPPYIRETGRFGLRSFESHTISEKAEAAALFLKQKRSGMKTLCLGTGEFMYLPMKIAAGMGDGIFYHSTTRSPVYVENEVGYGARFGMTFLSPEDPTVTNFVYNIPPNYYDDVFVFFERNVELENLKPFIEELSGSGVKSIKIVFFSKSCVKEHC